MSNNGKYKIVVNVIMYITAVLVFMPANADDYKLDKGDDSTGWYSFLGKNYVPVEGEELTDYQGTKWMKVEGGYRTVLNEQLLDKGSVNPECSITSAIEKPSIKDISAQNEDYQQIDIPGTVQAGAAIGAPVMPMKSFRLLIPYGQEVTSITVKPCDEEDMAGEYMVNPAQPPVRTGEKAAAKTQPDPKYYESEDTFPYIPCENVSVQRKGGYTILFVNVFPAKYTPLKKKIQYYEAIKVEVETASKEELKKLGVTVHESRVDKDADTIKAISTYVDNGGAVGTYESEGSDPAPPAAMGALDAGEYKYVIITSSAMQSSFQPLIQQKLLRAISARIVTTEYIYANYIGMEPVAAVRGDNADRIRQFIKDAYNIWGTRWVLLGGDTEIIPARLARVREPEPSTVSIDMATDVYYGCVDGPWNSDGDTNWGETNDGLNGGNVDILSEVYVGRAPVSSAVEAQNFINKTIQYENTKRINPKKALLAGEKMEDNVYGSDSCVEIRNECIPAVWSVTGRYDTASYEWTPAEMKADMNGSPHIINHVGHSNDVWNARLFNSDVEALTNQFPYFMYSQGCDAGAFDWRDVCIAEKHVISQKAAFGVIMNTRYGWYNPEPNDPQFSHYFALSFWDMVLNAHVPRMGEANQLAKEYLAFLLTSDPNKIVYRYIYLELTLFGDPETPFDIERLVGDLNIDNIINVRDMLICAKNYGQDPFNPDADINKDGTVNVKDLMKVAQNYGDSQ